MSKPKRIAILEDDEHLRVYLEEVIAEGEGLILAFSAETLAQAKASLARTACDLCLVDLRLPDGDGLSLLGPLRAAGAKALILTVLGDPASVLMALKAGADGYLLKETPPDQLRRSIASTLAGETPLSPQAATHLLETWKSASGALTRAAEGEGLTPREVEVLKLFSRGLSYREAADILGISPHTIGDHVKCIYRKLAVHSRSEAIFEARQMGLISLLD
ncbi:DNA-binding NarL/FixJ family response regulator [Caulobacter ginsengisoli]|uniref:DNA-binding NarL/FixJ family response regulator n=1 Tax=Caulobacter ginsengisoli TaxID=400775 RepID=A0ABU0INH4_9CAUL|nr:response regulator transcription factor [Caulobacter ginsengisoli]MDQ0463557.1 DNA-binding NarL/FixJ family response regulator [Caulobacter ginsengisoli]